MVERSQSRCVIIIAVMQLSLLHACVRVRVLASASATDGYGGWRRIFLPANTRHPRCCLSCRQQCSAVVQALTQARYRYVCLRALPKDSPQAPTALSTKALVSTNTHSIFVRIFAASWCEMLVFTMCFRSISKYYLSLPCEYLVSYSE